MAKYTVNVEYTDKYSYQNVKVGTVVELDEDRFNEIVAVLGEKALTKKATKTTKTTKKDVEEVE